MEDLILNPISEDVFKNYFTEQLSVQQKKLFIFDFWSEGCVTCPEQHEILKKIETETKYLKVFTINVDYETNYELAKTLSVKKLPTLFILDGSDSIIRFNGLTSYEELKRLISEEVNLSMRDMIRDAKERDICANCPEYRKNRTNVFGNHYCRKHKIYPFPQDSC